MSSRLPPWVIVAGSFHQYGGMDRANAQLAECLIAQGVPVHLVSHRVDVPLQGHPLVTTHLVDLPLGSFFLGEQLLDHRGRTVAKKVQQSWPGATVIINGGNCLLSGVNWVHYLHHSWNPEPSPGEPVWLRKKSVFERAVARRRERVAYSRATALLANSELTRTQILGHGLCNDASRVHTVYLGSDPGWHVATPAERSAAGRLFQTGDERPIVAFVGALGFDDRKGFKILFEAWRSLCSDPSWDADLVVAGAGRALDVWRVRVAHVGLSQRIRMLGFSSNVGQLLAAADLLVSPVAYEAYGLNVQEAICRGVPAIVSAKAGVAEQYPADLQMLLLANPADIGALVRHLRMWRQDVTGWRERVRPLGERLRSYTWAHMTERIVEVAGLRPKIPVSSTEGVAATARGRSVR